MNDAARYCPGQSRGSLSLTMLFSTMAGVLFILLFYNLTQYIGANAALKEAARKAARCISPTDPACIELTNNEAAEAVREWWGYAAKPGRERSMDLFVDYYTYSANMPARLWGADYDVYEVHRAKQPVRWNTMEVPVRRFTPLITDRRGAYRADFNFAYFRPRYANNFPEFEQDISASWLAWQSKHEQQFNWIHFAPRLVENNKTEIFETKFAQTIIIPRLENSAGIACFNADWSTCSVAADAGDKDLIGMENVWRDFAYLAIKVTAFITPVSGAPVVSWNSTVDDTDGLMLEIIGPDGSIEQRALGGRIWEEVPAQGFGYNLWLRGPDGAHGGDSNKPHDVLRVARGSTIQIKGQLAVRGGAASAEVHIGYYYDQYEQAETKHVSCRPLEFLGASNPNLCQTTATCTPESGSLGDVPKKVWWNWRRVACDELQLAPLGPGRASREHAVEAAVCDAAWRPENLLPDLFGSGKVQIGWEVSDMRVVELPAGGLCKQGRLAVYREYCGDDAIAGRRTEVSACSNVVSAVTAVEKNAETINTIQPKGAPRFAEKISPEMLAPEKDYWQFNWSARDESGGVLSTERNEVRRVRLSLRDPANLIRSFERMDGAEDKPLPVQFAQAILRENAERAGAYGWSEYAAKIADYVTVVQREAMVTAITGVYPFVEPVPEIYWGQNDLAKGWDFDRDCQVDAACHGEFVRYENEEQMLRAFAAKQYPQALDTRYVFHAGKSEYALTKIYADASPRNESQQSGFPPCTATKSVCSDGTSADFTELVHLGFGPEVPESCTQGIHHQCFARPYGTAYAAEPLVLEVDQQLIEQVALAEVRRIIPGALSAAQCGKAQTSGCTDVAVAFVDDRRVNVTVSYDMPLVFPLNAITGSNSLRIFQTKEEILERAAVGRETSLELAGLSG